MGKWIFWAPSRSACQSWSCVETKSEEFRELVNGKRATYYRDVLQGTVGNTPFCLGCRATYVRRFHMGSPGVPPRLAGYARAGDPEESPTVRIPI